MIKRLLTGHWFIVLYLPGKGFTRHLTHKETKEVLSWSPTHEMKLDITGILTKQLVSQLYNS